MASGETEGWIYFVHAPEVKRVKIGWTELHPDHRLAQLQTGSPVRLEPLGVVWDQKDLEADLHSKFGHLRHVGEWFDADEEFFAWIRTIMGPWPEKEKPKKKLLPPVKFQFLASGFGKVRHASLTHCDMCGVPFTDEGMIYVYTSPERRGQRTLCGAKTCANFVPPQGKTPGLIRHSIVMP